MKTKIFVWWNDRKNNPPTRKMKDIQKHLKREFILEICQCQRELNLTEIKFKVSIRNRDPKLN